MRRGSACICTSSLQSSHGNCLQTGLQQCRQLCQTETKVHTGISEQATAVTASGSAGVRLDGTKLLWLVVLDRQERVECQKYVKLQSVVTYLEKWQVEKHNTVWFVCVGHLCHELG